MPRVRLKRGDRDAVLRLIPTPGMSSGDEGSKDGSPAARRWQEWMAPMVALVEFSYVWGGGADAEDDPLFFEFQVSIGWRVGEAVPRYSMYGVRLGNRWTFASGCISRRSSLNMPHKPANRQLRGTARGLSAKALVLLLCLWSRTRGARYRPCCRSWRIRLESWLWQGA